MQGQDRVGVQPRPGDPSLPLLGVRPQRGRGGGGPGVSGGGGVRESLVIQIMSIEKSLNLQLPLHYYEVIK